MSTEFNNVKFKRSVGTTTYTNTGVLYDTATLVATIDNPNSYSTATNDNFGWSVDMDGNYAIVGAYNEDTTNALGNEGAAYIIDLATNSVVRNIPNPDLSGAGASGAQFGYTVGISGNYAAIGSPSHSGEGKLFIYEVSSGNLIHTITNPNAVGTGSNDSFGMDMAIDGNYIVVGAPFEDFNGNATGTTYIIDVLTGNVVHTINNPNTLSPSNDFFGIATSISGDLVAIGAYSTDTPTDADSGKVYVYSASTGNLLYEVDNPNMYSTAAGDLFGISVAISDKYLVVGARNEDALGNDSTGAIYIFDSSNGTLLHSVADPNGFSTPANDVVGGNSTTTNIDISGDHILVGAPNEDSVGSNSGAAYVINAITGAVLITLADENAYGSGTSDQYGHSVAIDGNKMIVSCPFEDEIIDTNSGKVYIYELS